MTERFEILWILPNLNEKFEVIKGNLELIKKFSLNRFKSFKIAVMDGGSTKENLVNLANIVSQSNEMALFLVLPALRPTKNKGIFDAIQMFKSENVAIIDSDCENLSENMLESLIGPVANNISDVSLPKVKKTGGRANRLICNPLLSIFFPEVRNKISYPLSGIIALKSKVLDKAIKENYFCDWGGEIQIIIRSAMAGRVNEFEFDKLDKTRGISSKKDDARQFYRAILYEAIVGGRLQNLKTFQSDQIGNFGGPYEKYLVNYLVIDVINEVLFNKKSNRKEINVKTGGVDFLRLKELHYSLVFLHLRYLNKLIHDQTSLNRFMQECAKSLANQRRFGSVSSIDVGKSSSTSLEKISLRYNSEIKEGLKVKMILEEYSKHKNI